MTDTVPKVSIAPLLAVNFVGTLGFSIVVPFLVVLVTKWGGNAVIYGVLSATYSFFQLFGAPILGRWSDTIGRRKVLLYSQIGTLVSWAIFLIAFILPTHAVFTVSDSFVGSFVVTLPLMVLFLARAADGLTGGNVSVSNAYLADITTEESRSENFGRMAISSNLGFIVGPAIAGLLGSTVLGEVLPVAVAFAISALAAFLIQFSLVDVKPVPIDQHLQDASACDVYGHEATPGYQVESDHPDGFKAMLGLPNMPVLMLVNFLVMLGFSVFYVAFPVYAVQNLGWEIVQMGVFFAVLSLFMVAVQGPVLAYAAKRVADKLLMIGGGLLLAVGFALLINTSTEIIYVAALLIALGNGLMWPTFMAVLSKSAGTELQGLVQGYAGSAGAVASILGLIGGGIAFVQFGASLFILAGIIIAVAAVLAGVGGLATTSTPQSRP